MIRAHLVAAAAHHSLPAGLSLDLLPIVEGRLVGYEFLPNQTTYTYLTIGCDERGLPVLRESSYRAGPPSVLRLASVDGRALPQREIDAALHLRQRDFVLPDWSSTAEAAWTELTELFPQQPRHRIEVYDARQECLDEALVIAHAHLADCDPCIDFCGIPDEAQYGFALTHANGGRGRLASRQPGRWALWFQSPVTMLNEEWAMSAPGIDTADAWVCAGKTPHHTTRPAAFRLPALPATSSRRSRKHRIEDRLDGDRRHADRRHAGRPPGEAQPDERRHEDRRRRSRRGHATQ